MVFLNQLNLVKLRVMRVFSVFLLLSSSAFLHAAEYVIDGSGAGMHASIQFRAKHMGISPLWGRFDDLQGSFTWDAVNPEASSVRVTINPASINTNHAERDAHLRSEDYINVDVFPEAEFNSTSVEKLAEGKIRVNGVLLMHGVSLPISIDAEVIGEGETLFGDYRVGFEGIATLNLSDFGIELMPDPQLELILSIEGIRQ